MKFSIIFILFIFVICTFLRMACCNNAAAYPDIPSSSLTGAYRPIETEVKFRSHRSCSHPFSKFMVSIRKFEHEENFGQKHFCAGLIIGPKLILSAAHCFVRDKQILKASSVQVVAGTPTRLRRNPDTQIMKVKKIIIHELYASPINVDVALLKLQHNMELDTSCAAIASLPLKRINESRSCVVLGWGKLFFNGPLANLILQINVTLHNKIYCEPLFFKAETSKYKMCASDTQDHAMNPCLGDSGGPLLCEGVLIGIVSYGFECDYGLPSVYTDVYELRNWIIENKCNTFHFKFLSFWSIILAIINITNLN